MGKIDTNVLKDGQLAVATAPQSGTIISEASAVDATALVQTDNGPQLCVKTVEVGEGGGGGGGTVDQTYDPTSTNAQSGTAVAQAVAPALKNTATGTNALTILGTATNSDYSLNIGKDSTVRNICSVAIGNSSSAGERNCVVIGHSAESKYGYQGCVAVGQYSKAKADYSIAIGRAVSASAIRAIQLGGATDGNSADNTVANTLQVFQYQLLDGNTGKIPAERMPADVVTLDDYRTTVSNFQTGSYLSLKDFIDFESGTSYDFMYHWKTGGSTDVPIATSVDVEGTGGGFDLVFSSSNNKCLFISQSGTSMASGWSIDTSLGNMDFNTEYWFHMTWDGSTYTYVLATDKDFTNIVQTTTESYAYPIKNSSQTKPRYGRSIRFTTAFSGGTIYISDCYMKINGVKVFDGRRARYYDVVGSPSMSTVLY